MTCSEYPWCNSPAFPHPATRLRHSDMAGAGRLSNFAQPELSELVEGRPRRADKAIASTNIPVIVR